MVTFRLQAVIWLLRARKTSCFWLLRSDQIKRGLEKLRPVIRGSAVLTLASNAYKYSVVFTEVEDRICTHVQIRVGGVVQAGGLAGCEAGWGPGVRGWWRSPDIISPQATCLCCWSTPRWPSVYTSESSQAQHISMNAISGQNVQNNKLLQDCKEINLLLEMFI